jgi:hypothetical protein
MVTSRDKYYGVNYSEREFRLITLVLLYLTGYNDLELGIGTKRLLGAHKMLAIRLLSIFVVVRAISFASATDFWITQSGAGTANGSSLANAASCGGAGQSTCSAFNSSANWGSGSAQIGPGTTVHLSGTITAAANACNYMTFQSGGASGNPIILHFESGSVLTAPTWGAGCGAVYSTGHSYITVDGGATGCAVYGSGLPGTAGCTSAFVTGGKIQATANGTGLTYQANASGIAAYSCSNCTFKNLTISNIYVHTSLTDESGDPTGAIYVDGGSNVLIANNVAHDMKWCLEHNWNNGDTNVTFSNNQVYNVDHGVVEATGGTGAAFTNVYVFGNWYHDPGNWDDNGNLNHHDGVHIWSFGTGNSITGAYVYNNYFSGNFGMHMNSAIYQEAFPTGAIDWVFNNVVAPSGGSTGNGYMGLGANGGAGGWNAVNNTIFGYSTSIAGEINTNSTAGTIYNNVIATVQTALGVASPPAAVDYDNYWALGSGGLTGGGASLAVWVGYCQSSYTSTVGCDAHATASNPNLSSSFVPNAGSATFQAGKNLYSTCNGQPNPGLGALCYDAAGNQRPQSGNWDIGAFQYQSTVTSGAPNAPTLLTASVE